MVRTRLGLAISFLLVLSLASGVDADVVTTEDGLVLEGSAVRGDDGVWRIETPDGTVTLAARQVKSVEPGDGPRTKLLARRDALAAGDLAGWYRLALEAEAAGLPLLAREAFEHVVSLDGEHAASRRALGHEKVDGQWVTVEVARRRHGLVLYEGRWMLPAEVEAAARVDEAPATHPTPGDDARTRQAIRTWATADAPLSRAARVALAGVPDARRVRAALRTLYDPDARVRRVSARMLGELGDESGLRPLLLSGARDVDPDVRGEAVLAAASFGHDDTAIPYVRALGSENLRLVANAAQALAALGDQRALGYIVKRLTSHGSSARSFVSFMNQVSYVRDYDVEIAQASNIANPDVATILDGVILDIRVIDAGYTRTWVEPILVGAASELAGRRFENRDAVLAWYAEAKDELPAFPEAPAKRKRKTGRILGATGGRQTSAGG